MKHPLHEIIRKHCYTEQVYTRINKKLNTQFNNNEIESFMRECITAQNIELEKIGKNYYLKNYDHHITITINSNNYRIITVNRF